MTSIVKNVVKLIHKKWYLSNHTNIALKKVLLDLFENTSRLFEFSLGIGTKT